MIIPSSVRDWTILCENELDSVSRRFRSAKNQHHLSEDVTISKNRKSMSSGGASAGASAALGGVDKDIGRIGANLKETLASVPGISCLKSPLTGALGNMVQRTFHAFLWAHKTAIEKLEHLAWNYNTYEAINEYRQGMAAVVTASSQSVVAQMLPGAAIADFATAANNIANVKYHGTRKKAVELRTDRARRMLLGDATFFAEAGGDEGALEKACPIDTHKPDSAGSSTSPMGGGGSSLLQAGSPDGALDFPRVAGEPPEAGGLNVGRSSVLERQARFSDRI